MADEDLALEGAEAEGAQAQEAEHQQDPVTIEALAAEMGWAPKDQFRGDPDKWKPADQFIRDGHDIQQSTSRELRSMREQMERPGGVTETIVRDRVSQARQEWEQQLNEAVEEGDTKRALELARQEPREQREPGPDPSVAAWVAKNEWFTKDPAAQLRAQEVSERLAQQGRSVADQLEAAERIIRNEFPEHFPKAKEPPGTQTGQQRNASPGNRQKGFNDMPEEARRYAVDLEERLGVKKEDVAKRYWANREGVRK